MKLITTSPYFLMKHKNTTIYTKTGVDQKIVLPTYTLDSLLVLLPGIIYNVTFSRFKAAALLLRFRKQAEGVPFVKSLLEEYNLDSSEEAPVISAEAEEGIQHFRDVESQIRSGATSVLVANGDTNPTSRFVFCVEPNAAKIPEPSQGAGSYNGTRSDVVTVTRIVGLVDDSDNVRLTLQALVRATVVRGYNSQKGNENYFTVQWDQKAQDVKGNLQKFKTKCKDLFVRMDKFVDEYRLVYETQNRSTDLLTLSPLANALYLQLAGSKDFSKAYKSLQRIVQGTDADSDAQVLLRVVDLTAAIVPFPVHEKYKLLRLLDLNDRVSEATEMVSKMSEVFLTIKENNSRINHWFQNEASNMQRANLVANQLKSIRVVLEGLTKKGNTGPLNALVRRKPNGVASAMKKPGGPGGLDDEDTDDDDLRAIAEFIRNKLPEIKLISDDSKALILKDFKRVKTSSPGNADFHVIRNYLDIVVDLPWDRYLLKFKSNKDINLLEARNQLDEDHFGLHHVKTRLIQYLVVLKLLGANADAQFKQIHEAEKAKRLEIEKENKKFTRESTNGEAIIILNEETRSGRLDEQGDANGKSGESDESAKSILVSKNNKSPIIMLAGPPGVGKTSLAKSIATTLGRKFQRISLGGVRDESEIRGHRRTYVGAMPGLIVQALRKAGSMNPVILLDEIDKVVGGHNSAARVSGDPAAALLEVLDPEQNTNFMDHYLGFPIDLSQVIFICTANEPHNLSTPLLDRLEMIEIGAYDYSEKLKIGQKYLLPRQLKRNGFPEDATVHLSDEVMKKIILDYTREAGVRNLERKLGTVCRFKAVEYSESLSDSAQSYNPTVTELDLSRFLGIPFPNLAGEIEDTPVLLSRYGVVNGLSYNSDGSGSVLTFESIGITSEKGMSLNMTGRLGEVLMESAKIGLTFIRNTLSKHILNLEDTDALLDRLKGLEIHMHVPAGAVSKDGPSAGITMALSFLSLLLEKPVPSTIAMTGEITLRGRVLPIGGLKEKMLGAHLTHHVNKIIVPRANRRDILEEYVKKLNQPEVLNELLEDNSADHFKNSAPEDYFYEKYGVRLVYAREFWDVIRHVWGNELLVKVEQARLQEYHL